ncbi:glycosyltransferase family 4 protein [uncultured Jatrophihabitans sp.]|uniref:glycosyltransferase family 4 protein n=1 Tax=uncultured Jatrophihabitans sp. TaxID=1610747 RepID=UPI0035CBEB85
MRIALTSYRSKPHCGGQGVYVRALSRALVDLGHSVEVFSGPPYPDLDPRVALTAVPSLDLYREADPFRVPRPSEFRTPTDVLEFLTMCTAGFPEPRTFSRRVAPLLAARRAEFDVVHDNQSLGPALLRLPAAGVPLVSTIHHPITVDRRLALAGVPWQRQLTIRRWFGFVRYQARVAARMPLSIVPSRSSMDDIVADLGVRRTQLREVPNGVDTELFRPRGARVAGRLVSMCSADVPLKGLQVLLRAVAELPESSPVHLIAVARPEPGGATEKLVSDLGIAHRVTFVNGLSDDELAELVASAELMCVPSLYEGFSLPAVEAMASGTPLVASATSALPDVVGRDGRCGVLVPPGDHRALAAALHDLHGDAERRVAMGAAARERAVSTFSWAATAQATVDVYREAIALTGESHPC